MANRLILAHTSYLNQNNGVGTNASSYDVSTNPYGVRIINKGTVTSDANEGNPFALKVTNVQLSKGMGSSNEPVLDVNSGDPKPSVGSTDSYNLTLSVMLDMLDSTTTSAATYDFNDKDVLQFLTLMTRTKGLVKIWIDNVTDAKSSSIMLRSIPLIYDPIGSDIERGTSPVTLYSGAQTLTAGTDYGPFWARLTGFQLSNTPDTKYVQGQLSFTIDMSYTA